MSRAARVRRVLPLGPLHGPRHEVAGPDRRVDDARRTRPGDGVPDAPGVPRAPQRDLAAALPADALRQGRGARPEAGGGGRYGKIKG